MKIVVVSNRRGKGRCVALGCMYECISRIITKVTVLVKDIPYRRVQNGKNKPKVGDIPFPFLLPISHAVLTRSLLAQRAQGHMAQYCPVLRSMVF